MKAKQISSMSVKELEDKLLELKKEMIKYRTQISAGTSIKSPAMVSTTKRTIARLMHALSTREE